MRRLLNKNVVKACTRQPVIYRGKEISILTVLVQRQEGTLVQVLQPLNLLLMKQLSEGEEKNQRYH